jgi:spore coat polysaccharide biosynthesis protein SpsF (cytidylyltransferase family)
VFNKPFRKINDIPILAHLINRIADSGIQIYVAIPDQAFEINKYDNLLKNYVDRTTPIILNTGSSSCPLSRMYDTAHSYNLDPVIRICHDKIFVDPANIKNALKQFKEENADYLYSSHLIDGTGFEIISRKYLALAARKTMMRSIEHISYAIKSLDPKTANYKPNLEAPKELRLLIDYEDDINFLNVLFKKTDSYKPSIKDILAVVKKEPELMKINKLPLVTLYTCAYNEEAHIGFTMQTMKEQTLYDECEYIVIDDCSKDHTDSVILGKKTPNMTTIFNDRNMGLASSSNIALSHARGKYILRMDADDSFLGQDSLENLYHGIEATDYDCLYPMFFDQKLGKVLSNKKAHHVGGAIFKTSAVNHIKFTDRLRGYEGLDFFHRAKDNLKIGYYDKVPIFHYADRKNSMSKSNRAYRKEIKDKIDKGIYGKDLVDG